MLGGVSGVIDLKEKQMIIKLYLGGMSKRQIAKEVKMSRNTVSKYIKQFEQSKSEDVRNVPIT